MQHRSSRDRDSFSMNGSAHLDQLRLVLADGPMRFAPPAKERSVEVQLSTGLKANERDLIEYLACEWDRQEKDAKTRKHDISIELFLRFVRCHPELDKISAWKSFSNISFCHCNTVITSIPPKLLHGKSILILPDLRTKDPDKRRVVYVEPAKFNVKDASTKDIFSYLIYMLRVATESEDSSTNGICVLLNMEGWTMKDYSVHFWSQFMQILSGNIFPINVHQILLVDTPRWFGTVIRMIQRMVSPEFMNKLKRVCTENLHMHIICRDNENGDIFEYLPDEMSKGRLNSNSLGYDFICYRVYVEQKQREAKQKTGRNIDFNKLISGTPRVGETSSSLHRSPMPTSPRRQLLARAFSARISAPAASSPLMGEVYSYNSPRQPGRPGIVKAMSSKMIGFTSSHRSLTSSVRASPKQNKTDNEEKSDRTPKSRSRCHPKPSIVTNQDFHINLEEESWNSRPSLTDSASSSRSIDSHTSFSMYFE